jgi:tetratricopeptide (TPR) repeat protein
METLIIYHLPNTDPPQFTVERSDGMKSDPVAIQSPFEYPVKDRPNTHLVKELQWYLEDFLTRPYPPDTDVAMRITEALDDWGKSAFTSLFDNTAAREMFDHATENGLENLNLQVMSDVPLILQWPWEALFDPESSYLSIACKIERRLNRVRDPIPIPPDIPKDKINILLVVARPYEQDVKYRSISRPIVELIESLKIPAFVHILRPPSFTELRNHLKDKKGFYHIVHFDGHGGYGRRASSPTSASRHRYNGAKGVLVFETENGEPEEVETDRLSALLIDCAVPIVALNACRSAMLDKQADDPFASVAASLLKAGIRSVVAMSYAFYVSGAQEFLPSFYSELFKSGDLSSAVRAGRHQMFDHKGRTCSCGKYDLNDFIVPVVFQQERFDLSFIKDVPRKDTETESVIPDVLTDTKNPYGFIGRDSEILELERAIRKDVPAVLIQGLGGVGKSTLARGFVKWLYQTGGIDSCVWLEFNEIRSAEYVINQMITQTIGDKYVSPDINTNIATILNIYERYRIITVWDNFENACGIPGTYINPNLDKDDQALLLTLLQKCWNKKGKFIITSRSEEEWLDTNRMKIPIHGLSGEEAWEYCDKIIKNLGIRINRKSKEFSELMDMLGGHPLAMRIVLPRIEKLGVAGAKHALEENIKYLGPSAEALYSTIKLIMDQIDNKYTSLLILCGFHDKYFFSNMLALMVERFDKKLTESQVMNFLEILVKGGVLNNLESIVYEMHPALTSYLRSTLYRNITPEIISKWDIAFIEVMANLASELASLKYYEQKIPFYYMNANLHNAYIKSKEIDLFFYTEVLAKAISSFAFNSGNYTEAKKLILDIISQCKNNELLLEYYYYQLGIIAQEQRDFKNAELWHLKSLELSERAGHEHGIARTYYQLGRINEEQRNFEEAKTRYNKSLEIDERTGNKINASNAYHQLGMIAQEQRDLKTAEIWHKKSLEIKEKSGDQSGTAASYHQLGIISVEQHNFKEAENWFRKALEIDAKLGNEKGAAITYQELGILAMEQNNFKTAEDLIRKSLSIKEKLGDLNNAAITYLNMGALSNLQGRFIECTDWLIKALLIFIRFDNQYYIEGTMANIVINYKNAPDEIQPTLRKMWEDAGLGEFPQIPDSE